MRARGGVSARIAAAAEAWVLIRQDEAEEIQIGQAFLEPGRRGTTRRGLMARYSCFLTMRGPRAENVRKWVRIVGPAALCYCVV